MFVVKGTDTSGSIELKRETQSGALKKAKELTDDGRWDVSMPARDGRVYPLDKFAQLEA